MDNAIYSDELYAIIDTVARKIIGGIYLHRHEASAVRFYADVASDPQSIVGKHPQDFDLVRLGYVRHNQTIEEAHSIVLKGSLWAAAQAKGPELIKEA